MNVLSGPTIRSRFLVRFVDNEGVARSVRFGRRQSALDFHDRIEADVASIECVQQEVTAFHDITAGDPVLTFVNPT